MAQTTSIPGLPVNFHANLPVTATTTHSRPGWATVVGDTLGTKGSQGV